MVRAYALDNAYRQEVNCGCYTVHRPLRVLDISLPRRRNLPLRERSKDFGRISTRCPSHLQWLRHDDRSVGCFGCRRWTAYCNAAARDAAVFGFDSSSALIDFRNRCRFVSWTSRSLPHATSAIDHWSTSPLNHSASSSLVSDGRTSALPTLWRTLCRPRG